jgi:hypothetical protein
MNSTIKISAKILEVLTPTNDSMTQKRKTCHIESKSRRVLKNRKA